MRGWANANTNKNLHTVNIQGMWLNVGAKDPAKQERAFTPSLAQNTSKTRFSLKFFPVASEFRQNRPDAKFAILKIREVVLLIKNAKGPQTRPFFQSTQKTHTVPTPLLVKNPLSPNCVVQCQCWTGSAGCLGIELIC